MDFTSEKSSAWVKLLACCFGLVLLKLAGCAAHLRNPAPEAVPNYVKAIKTVRVYADGTLANTGIVVHPEELLSVMAVGTIRQAKSSRTLYPSSCYCLLLQVDDSTPSVALLSKNGSTYPSSWEGALSFKIHGAQASFFPAHFDVTVIVWKTKDYSLISEFLKHLANRFPDHPGIYEASISADTLKELQLGKEIVAGQIEATRNQITQIEGTSDDPNPEINLPTKRIQFLQKKLGTLIAKAAELDDLARQIHEQRALSADISRKLQLMDQRKTGEGGGDGKPAQTPPLLLVTQPEEDCQVDTDAVRLIGAVEDDTGLERLEIFINGELTTGSQERSLQTASGEALRTININRIISLVPGNNSVLIRATDTDGLVSEKILQIRYAPTRRSVWAVIVGINDYPRLPKLKYAVNDAREFQRLLVEKNRIPEKNITLLLDDQANLSNLRSILGTQLKELAGKDDMVVIFFAGHGATEVDASSAEGDGLEKYLMTWEANPRDLYSTAMPMAEVARILNRIRSERLIFIADACYSGASGGRTVGTGGIRAHISDTFLDRLASGKGKVILGASAASEVSVEKDELRHGVFTYYLLEGLQGAADRDNDSAVTVDEVFSYVSEKVPQVTGQEQHPVKKGTVEGNLVMSILN